MKKLSKKKKPPPEGPEVKVMGWWLKNFLFGNSVNTLERVHVELTGITPLSGRYTKGDAFQKLSLIWQYPRHLRDVRVHGKFLWVESAESAYHVCFTMGMTGNFRAVEHKYARLKFEFRDHAPLYFIDKRNFGTVRLLHTSKIQHKLAQLGPDPLQKPIACDDHWYAIRHKWRDLTLAEFLMNQSVIAGIGNYLKCEILWEAGLSPHRFAGELSPMGMSRLLDAINRVPQVSFRNNGASIIDYATPDNLLGTFSRYFNVYGKKRDVNGDPVIKEKTKDGRSTYWSPMRQLYLPV